MLSISNRGAAGDATAYLVAEQGDDDYYAAEEPGRWHGNGAAVLGLSGQVHASDFQAVAEGRDPSGHDLVQGAGEQHRAGWDLTFSAPKSVSAVWAVSDDETRQAIQTAHQKAVERALQHMKEHAVMTRRGHGGVEHERAEMVAALFDHRTSRAGDPQCHTHAFVHNVAIRSDGTMGTLESRYLYQHKMAAGALYRAELGAELQRQGLAVERDAKSFRVAGTPKEIEATFSQRRQQIEQAMATYGVTTARGAEMAALDTRQAKDNTNRVNCGWIRNAVLSESVACVSSAVTSKTYLACQPIRSPLGKST